jgi:class 3 adenylate cyclase
MSESDLRARTSEVAYVRVGDEHVAYRVIDGDRVGGPAHDVVLVMPGTASMEALFDDPVARRLLDGLASLGRLVVFDRRGIGLSDAPAADWGVESWCADVVAVVEATSVHRPVVVSNIGSSPIGMLFCDRRADDVSALVMLEPFPFVLDAELARSRIRAQIAGEEDSLVIVCPSRADEPGFREWFDRAGRIGASPRAAERAHQMIDGGAADMVSAAAARLTVPTLLLRRPAHALSPSPVADPMLATIPNVQRVDLPGRDLLIYGGEVDALLAEINRFVTGEHRIPEPERVIAAVLFTDLVASTARTAQVGDANWKRMMDRHDAVVRECVGRRGGTIVRPMGDGIVACFPSATSAIRAGQELRSGLGTEQLDVRVGIHIGEIDRRGDDISGIAVNIAARVMALAGGGELLVSEAVPPVAVGSGIDFESWGEVELRGVPGRWRLFRVTA